MKNKQKKNKKKNKVLDLARELKKAVENEGDGDTNCDKCTWNGPQRLRKRNGGDGNWRTNPDYPGYNIVKNGKNTEKSPGDLKRLAITQIPVKYHQRQLVGRISKM